MGADSYVSFGVHRARGALLVLNVNAAHNQREDRGKLAADLTPIWHYGTEWTFTTPAGLIDAPGRRGFGVMASLGYSRSEERGWAGGSVRIVSEEYRRLRILNDNLWTRGDHRWFEFHFTMHGFGDRASKTVLLSTSIRIASDWMGGDFDYRRVALDIAWAKPQFTAWAAGGTSTGNLPIQERFDIAVEGQVRGIPIWQARPDRFASMGCQARIHLLQEVFAGVFGTAAGGNDMAHPIFEGGLSLVAASDDENSEPHEWFIQLDLPVYSSEAQRYSGRPKWDLGRFMIKVNIPLSEITGSDIIRYRYPNR